MSRLPSTKKKKPPALKWRDFGKARPFSEILQQQRQCREDLLAQEDRQVVTILTGTHEPTVTLGYRASLEDDLRQSPKVVESKGIKIERCERGGRATYHGPSQLMFYVVMHLPTWKLRVTTLTQILEATAVGFFSVRGIQGAIGGASSGKGAGVWVPQGKLASVGLHISRGASIQGMCLNLAADLRGFQDIVPCGDPREQMVSLASVLRESSLVMKRKAWGEELALSFMSTLLAQARAS